VASNGNPRQVSLQERLHQTRPFRSAAQEAVVGLLYAGELVRRALGSVIEEEGLTLQQFNVLRILRGAGDGGVPTLQIRDRMIEKTPGLTGLLDRLEGKKLVHRRRCTEDRRRVWCSISKHGLELLRRLDEAVAAQEERLIETLTLAQQQLLVELQGAVWSGYEERFGLLP
jgi:DNA-binding MarR family transcriptional regulator